MKKTLFLILVFVSLNSFSQTWKTGIDIISYDLTMNLDTVKKQISNNVIIRLDHTDTTRIIKFLFADVLKLDKAELNNKKLIYSRIGDTLIVTVGIERNCQLTFSYILPDSSFLYDKAFVFTRPMKWCPYVYDDLSELRLKVTVPQGYKAFASGQLTNCIKTKNNQTYEYENKFQSGLPLIIAPEKYYKETDKQQNGIAIKYYFHNNDTVLTNSIINESLSVIDFCSNYIGAYQRPQLTYIEWPGYQIAQSLETFLLMGEAMVSNYSSDPYSKMWVAHETIHQWIGVGYFTSLSQVTTNRWFAEESFTESIRYTYLEKKYGKDTITGQIKWVVSMYNDYIKGTDQDVPISENTPNWVTYSIGPLIFYIVKKEIGDDNWHNFIKTLYSNYYRKIIDYTDFKKTLEKFADKSVIDKMEKDINQKGIPDELASP